MCFQLHHNQQIASVYNFIFLGSILVDDSLKLSEINHFAPNSVLQITHNHGMTGGPRILSPFEKNLINMEILLRNANECNKFTKKNMDSHARERFTEPTPGTEIEESFPVYGDLLERIGIHMATYSTQLHRLADVLSKDEPLHPASETYEEARRVIVNTGDTAKYTMTLMKNLSTVKVDMTNNRLFQ
jgi:hypothetical protein